MEALTRPSGSRPWRLYSFAFASAPGRLEVAANHVTTRAAASSLGHRRANVGGWRPRTEDAWWVAMEGFGTDVIDLDDADWRAPAWCETQSSAALLRGMLAAYDEAGGVARFRSGHLLGSARRLRPVPGRLRSDGGRHEAGFGWPAGVPAPAPGQDAAEGEGIASFPESRGAGPGGRYRRAALLRALRCLGRPAGQCLRRHGCCSILRRRCPG